MARDAHVIPSARDVLENGARMGRMEFHRRYEASSVERAELVEGVVYVASPLRAAYHGIPEGTLGAWAGVYRSRHEGVRVAHNSTVYLDVDNEYQPDICVWRDGGRARLVDGYIDGPPDLVIEIAASSSSVDLHEKKTAYRRNGVGEYLVFRVFDGELDWFVLDEGEYRLAVPGADGVIESRQFPGLRLPVAAFLDDDIATVLAAVS